MANPEWDNYKPQQYVYVLHYYDPTADRGENHGVIAVYACPIDAEKEKIRLEELNNRDLQGNNQWSRWSCSVVKTKYFD